MPTTGRHREAARRVLDGRASEGHHFDGAERRHQARAFRCVRQRNDEPRTVTFLLGRVRNAIVRIRQNHLNALETPEEGIALKRTALTVSWIATEV